MLSELGTTDLIKFAGVIVGALFGAIIAPAVNNWLERKAAKKAAKLDNRPKTYELLVSVILGFRSK